jgi:hypothetical protein
MTRARIWVLIAALSLACGSKGSPSIGTGGSGAKAGASGQGGSSGSGVAGSHGGAGTSGVAGGATSGVAGASGSVGSQGESDGGGSAGAGGIQDGAGADGAAARDGAVGGSNGPPHGITAAGDDTCATWPNGAVACWGDDSAGQLGDGLTAPRARPVMVVGGSGGLVNFSMAAHRTCVSVPGDAGISDGSTICWGPGPPAVVPGIAAANGLNVSDDHACSFTGSGLLCWGDNTYGQLGDGTTNSSEVPVPVTGLSGDIWFIVGSDVTCGWDYQTTSWCWGNNTDGQLGDGTTVSKSVPVQILPGPEGTLAPIGRLTFSFPNNNLFCSGTGACGDGGGATSVRLKPTQTALSSWPRTNPVGSDQTSCLVLGDDSIACWGVNSHGQLGDGTMVDRFTPAAVLLPCGAQGKSISATTDGSSFYAVMMDNSLYAWGRNDRGQLGDGTTTDRSTPVLVVGVTNPYAPTAGNAHACSQSYNNFIVQCWGANDLGQVGDGTFVDRPTPETITF